MRPGPGRLFVVATPIGNLGDITLRALDVLKAVACVVCEDTRRTRQLLDRHGIRTRTQSYHKFNESARWPGLVRRLLAGEDLALVSDGGTPCVSDPGVLLVRRAAASGVAVVPIPGPSACMAAVSAAGLPADRIHFEGFLPARAAARRARIAAIAGLPETLVLYEAPHRIGAALRDLAAGLGNREAALGREITKLHEEWIRGTLQEIGSRLGSAPKGEITLVVGGRGRAPGTPAEPAPERLIERIRSTRAASRGQAVREAARSLGISRREAYREWLRRGDRPASGEEPDPDPSPGEPDPARRK